jgi:hypothetical protein
MSLLRDLRHASRTLFRSPAYALTCVAVLALGIGANTAIFSVVHSVILTPLPYPDASRLVFVWERFPNMPDPPGGRIQVARENYLEWKRQNTVFSDIAAFRDMPLDESGIDEPQRVSTGFASANLFPILGVRARFGRLFAPDEERKDNDHVAVLTDKYSTAAIIATRRRLANPLSSAAPHTPSSAFCLRNSTCPPLGKEWISGSPKYGFHSHAFGIHPEMTPTASCS